jgi:hypothetical protein
MSKKLTFLRLCIKVNFLIGILSFCLALGAPLLLFTPLPLIHIFFMTVIAIWVFCGGAIINVWMHGKELDLTCKEVWQRQ